MVLEKLGIALQGAIRRIARSTHVGEQEIKDLVRELQRALLQSDVNVELVFSLTRTIEKRALEEKIPPGMSRKEHVVKIVYEELSKFLGKPSQFSPEPGKVKTVLMVGLQGSGKTTSVAKLARHFSRRGFRVGVVCADTFRPGAYEQLVQLCAPAGIQVYGDPKCGDPIKLASEGVRLMREGGFELILVDTAGRHRKEEDLMIEMKNIAEAIRPDRVILVVDATIGQQAREQAKAFKQATDIGGIIVTKLDGTAKGGGALSAVAATGATIDFIGVGEHTDDIEPFVPERFVARLLGMGDLETLLRKIKDVIQAGEAEEADARAILSGKLTLRDVYRQLEAMSKMGPLKKVMQMLPGVGASLPEEQMRVGEEKLKRFKVIMQSMTPEELENPKIINSSRIRRIARGSGTSEADVRELLKQYEMVKRMLKMFGKGRGLKAGPLAKLMKGGPGAPGTPYNR